ncbi:MAG: sensor histidine kinase [Limnospira sp.]
MYQEQPLRRILLIDDNPDDRLLIDRALKQEFSDTAIEEVGEPEGLEQILETGDFDLVITDYQLCWGTGLQILERVKSRYPDCPVIMFTNTGTEEIAVEAMKAGLDDYIIKSPQHFHRLTQGVRWVWERVQNRRRAIQSEYRLQCLLDQLSLGVFFVHSDGKLLRYNPALLNVLGLECAEEVETFIRERLRLDLADATLRRQIGSDQAPQQYREIQFRRGDGRLVWLRVSTMPERFDGSFIIDGLIEDISDRKRAEAEIRQLNQTLESRIRERTAQLEATNQELEIFAYSVSHDLQAPLRQINGFVSLLQEHFAATSPDPTSASYLETIANLTQQAGRMLEELLRFSRTGRVQMSPTWVDPMRLVELTRQQAEIDLEGREIVWTVEPLPRVWADRELLQTVFQNLLENAVKYTRLCERAEIAIAATESEKEVIYSVRDNGVGFDMKYADKLFGPFQRLHSRKVFEGMGIGLANVRRIVHRHGGKVWAQGEPGNGATFYFSLPKESSRSSDDRPS